MSTCKAKSVEWAIFSDLSGVWFPHLKHQWYEKDPRKVTEIEFSVLLKDFDEKLSPYSEIAFYHHPKRFHPLYLRLLRETKLAARVKKIKHLSEIA